MNKIIILILVFGAVLAIYSFASFTKITNQTEPIPEVSDRRILNQRSIQDLPVLSVYAKNLEVPWSIAFLPFDSFDRTPLDRTRGEQEKSAQGGPDGSMLVTERTGKIRLINRNGKLELKPLLELSDIKQVGESGLHGIALHPNFEKNRYTYIYYTYGEKNRNTNNKVVRYKYAGGKFLDPKIIVNKIPGAIFHDGGRIKFGPDGFLYITTGDAQNPSLAQNINSLAGKILRVTDDGKPATGNPFNNLVYSYGHRNPQGLAWDNLGRLWSTEHGSSAFDELNLIEPGKNYGWPIIRGDEKREGMVSPAVHSGNDTWAPAGVAYLEGSMFFGGLKGASLFEYRIKENKLIRHLHGKLGRVRDVIVGPDGMLYITTSNRDGRGIPSEDDDKILRINPSKLSEL